MSCIKLDTNKLKTYNIEPIFNYNFSFINLNIHNIYIIYDILNTYEEYKLRNIYLFIYERINKLSEIYNINRIKKINSNKLTYIEFDNLLNEYINNDKVKEIIIINSIILYYLPI